LKRLAAYPVYLLINGVTALLFAVVSTVSAVYNINTVGFNPLELMLVGTVLESSVLLFEIPTGIVADVYSRRLSIIIGMFLIGFGFVLWGSVALFSTVLLAQVVWGIGYTFGSGATDAWISDELENKDVTQTFLRGSQSAQVGALLGTGISVVLASISLRLPLTIAGLFFCLLAIFLIGFMPENRFSPPPKTVHNTFNHLTGTFRDGLNVVKKSSVLPWILLIGVFFGLASEGLDRLKEMHFLTNFTFPSLGNLKPVVWFGIINAMAMVLGIAATEITKRQLKDDDPRTLVRFLLVINFLLSASMIGFALAGNFSVALASYLTAFLFRRVHSPIFSAWMNLHLESKTRATVLSMGSQADSLGQVVGGPILGAIATAVNLVLALAISGLILFPLLPLYWWIAGREKSNLQITK